MRRQRLGQHYLVDDSAITTIADIAGISDSERVLEIGTGRGSLTLELCKRSTHLEAYEIDKENFELTKRATRNFGNVNLHLEDVFKSSPSFDVLVSSLPYSRSSTFIEWLSQLKYIRAIVVVQDDFVRKLNARPGTRNYRAISAIFQLSSTLEVRENIVRSSFKPQPKVNSVIVLIKPRIRLRETEISMVKKLFSLKKRKLGAVLRNFGLEITPPTRIDRERKVQSIPPDELYPLIKALTAAPRHTAVSGMVRQDLVEEA